MNEEIDWNQFEPVERQPKIENEESEAIDWDQFEAVENDQPKKRKLEDLGWLEKNFSSEGQKLQAEENRNRAKAAFSGFTAGYSEGWHPALKVNEEMPGSNLAKIAGSLAPISWATNMVALPLKAAATLSPKFVKPLQSLGNLLGLSAAGGLYEGLEESAKKSLEKSEFVPPSFETIIKEGGKWAALDAALRTLGLGGRFAKALYNNSFKRGIPAIELLDEVTNKVANSDKSAQKAISILEGKPFDLIDREIKLSSPEAPTKTQLYAAEEFGTRPADRAADLRNRKIEQKDFTKLSEGEAAIPEPYLPGEFQPEIIAEETLESDLTKRIEGVSQRANTERTLGENIKNDVERTIETRKKETDALYDIAREVEEGNLPSVKRTADSIVEQIKRIEAGGLNLTPEGYNKAKNQLLNTLKDLGYGIESDAAGNIVGAIENVRQPLSKIVEVKRRLNNIINYDLLDTSAQDFLKGPVAELRGEIRKGYGAKNSKARKAFEEAEKKFGEFAESKGRRSIRNVRSTEKPESLARLIRTPSGLADLKEVLSPEQFSQVERELLEYLQGQSQERVSSLYRELRPSLSENSRGLVEEIIESKAPKGSPERKALQREIIQRKALDDIAQATITGQRPKMALDLWKTKEGQQLIKQSLEGNPNKTEVLKYLQDQSFKDFSTSVLSPEGKIDFKKLNTFLKDPATIENIRLVAGEEGVTFFNNLEQLSKRVDRNASIMEGVIDKASAPERARIGKDIDKLYQDRLKEIKNKKGKLTKEEELFQSQYNKEAIKERAEAETSKKELGKDRFKRAKEKREIETKENEKIRKENEALEAEREKSKIFNKIDAFINSYGFKVKGLLSALGVWQIGIPETIAGAAALEVISKIARSKSVHSAIKKAAVPQKSPALFIKALSDLEKDST